MTGSSFNWRWLLVLLAAGIIAGTIVYSQYLSNKIQAEEQQKIEQWLAASRAILNPNPDFTLPNMIRNGQQSIPVIETNEKDSITGYFNLDTTKAAGDSSYLAGKLREFKSQHKPVETKFSDSPYVANRYYFGHTKLLDQVRWFPLLQLLLTAILIFFLIYSIAARNRATQNQLWAGMAKETAHQLGTPLSSLQGWVEMLKEEGTRSETVVELQKDLDRLKLVSDRFSKIGSKPSLEPADVVGKVRQMVAYMRKRSTSKVLFTVDAHGLENAVVPLSPPLFDWVIENLLKNALDAMEGKGSIAVDITREESKLIVDVTDTGKGISGAHLRKVFKPGFTTKKRGWGLGLALSKRIIEEYHQGELFVKQSEPGKGTTFRIVLRGE